jgi:hypothetical protein
LRGDLQQAEQTFAQVLAMDRNFGESHGGLAVVHALQGKKAQAAEGAERALRLDPESLAAVYARMVLSGDTHDPTRFKKLALRLLSARSGPFGGSLADAVVKRTG